jgi:hypothetical protein
MAKSRKVNPHYKFTNKRVPLIAIVGVSLGGMSFLALLMTIILTFTKGGTAPLSYGITVIVATLFSAAGLFCSIKARMMRDTYIYFPTIGIVLNSVNLFFVIYILGRGIMAL